MPNYRRNYVAGGTYFFTVVTHERRPIFEIDANRKLLGDTMRSIQADWPFTAFAMVLLPDHFHCVWILPLGDDNYSTRISRIKETFTKDYRKSGGLEGTMTNSRAKKRERAVWQRRFWEHTIRDENDLIRCVDYIHWNPVKHGYVKRPGEWQWSTFHRFLAAGDYPANWGESDPTPNYNEPEWE